ncbi:MAG TPA: glycosyltransferase family 4 protein [Euzebya sp.]|nr:glycosyltransferase family 4 protein [Euzebya sp.]
MRIAVLAPIAWRVPPRHYGPWELFASLLTEGLVARGHDVTLFASADSITAARLQSVVPAGWSEDDSIEPKVAECLHIASAFAQAADFDVIHNGFDFLPLTYAGLVDTPMVTTIHGFSSPRIVPVYAAYDDRTTYVAISDSDRHPSLSYAATIHHGIDTDALPLGTGQGGYLAFFGRIHPDKGTVEAIATARAAGLPLRIAGIVQDHDYFTTQVAPLLDGDQIRYVGPVLATDRAAFLGNATALLHLIGFDEPFGFSVAEAMACGTPVIAFDRGSMGELITNGSTGMIVPDVPGAVAAVPVVAALDRRAIRADAVHRFGVDRMVDAYVDLYRRVTAVPVGG